jgi:hypothetical protein
VSKSKKTPLTFYPHDWVPLKAAFLRIRSHTETRDLALDYFNRDLRSGRLGSALVESDGKETPLNPSYWQQRTVKAAFNPEEGVWVEPYVDGYIRVWRVDLDKWYRLAAAPTVTAAPQLDETRPPERRRGPVTTHDWHSIDGEIARRCIDPKTSRVAVPKKENALVAEMRTWCKAKGWAVPAISEMSEAVRRVCAPLRTVQK